MQEKTVTRRACGLPSIVPFRARASDFYCPETCRPRCDLPGAVVGKSPTSRDPAALRLIR